MTTSIVFESALGVFDRDAVPERDTNVIVVARFAHPRHRATLAIMATRPYLSFTPIG
jgi:hypothetical protein